MLVITMMTTPEGTSPFFIAIRKAYVVYKGEGGEVKSDAGKTAKSSGT